MLGRRRFRHHNLSGHQDSLDLPDFFALAHLAFINAAIFALAAALIVLRAFFTGFAPLTFAHLAFWAARIAALPAALILRFFGALVARTGVDTPPPISALS